MNLSWKCLLRAGTPIRPAVVPDLAITQRGLRHSLAHGNALATPAVGLISAGVGNRWIVAVIVVINSVQPRGANGHAAHKFGGKVLHGTFIAIPKQIVCTYGELESPRENAPPTARQKPVTVLQGVAGISGQHLDLPARIAEAHGGCPGDRLVIPHGIARIVGVVAGDGAVRTHDEEVHTVNTAAGITRLGRSAGVQGCLRAVKVEIEVDGPGTLYHADEVAARGVEIEGGSPGVLESVLASDAKVWGGCHGRRSEVREHGDSSHDD